MRSGILSFVAFLVIAIPTIGLVMLSWQWLASQEAQRFEGQLERQLEAVEWARDRAVAALDQLVEGEDRRSWTESFHLMQRGLGAAGTDVGVESRWPAILQGSFAVSRDGLVCAPTLVPVPELAEALRPLRHAAEELAAGVERSLGESLRSRRRRAAMADPPSTAVSESWPCEEVDALLRSISSGEGVELDCRDELVAVTVQAASVLCGEGLGSGTIAATRVVRVRGHGTVLVGALVDNGRLEELVGERGLPDGEVITLERTPLRPWPAGWAVARSVPADDRLRDFVVVLRERVPNAIQVSGRTWRSLFLGFCVLLTLVLTASAWAMQRFIAGSILLQREREHFVASVTHELRTPLAAIRMFAELLEGAEPVRRSEASSRFVQHILGESGRLQSLIENVLALTAIEQAAHPIERTEGDLGEAVRSMLAARRPFLEGQQIDLEVEIEESLPALRFDRLAVERILGNLLENAVKYGVTAESRSIEVSVDRVESSLVLEVGDRGRGLEKEDASSLFRRFGRGRDRGKETRSGVGLGLSIVLELANLHGAEASAHARPGGGALFRVVFPL